MNSLCVSGCKKKLATFQELLKRKIVFIFCSFWTKSLGFVVVNGDHFLFPSPKLIYHFGLTVKSMKSKCTIERRPTNASSPITLKWNNNSNNNNRREKQRKKLLQSTFFVVGQNEKSWFVVEKKSWCRISSLKLDQAKFCKQYTFQHITEQSSYLFC